MKKIVALMSALLLCVVVMAQGKVNGKVYDGKSGTPVEYATVTLHKPSDTTLVTGATTDDKGNFALNNVAYGTYLMKVSFMGYKPYFYPTKVVLDANHKTLSAGKITISPTATMLKEAEVVAERSMVEYKLDKRVVNVDKNIVTGGGTASDVLEQVPSVALDNDGNVTLRGSSNVKVLINGRPSELLGSDVSILLEQIPASTVENVEIITNPSAKYDPEGMSGIINIKLKDNSSGALGLNGVASLNLGTPIPEFLPTTMGTLNLNYSTEKYTISFSADGGQRWRGMNGTTDIARLRNGSMYSHDSLYEHNTNCNYMGSAKLGLEYKINDKNTVLLSYQLRGGNRKRQSGIDAVDLLDNGLMDYFQADTNRRKDLNHTINFNWTKNFDEKDRQLTFDATYSNRHGLSTGWQQQQYDDYLSNLANYYLRESEAENTNHNVNIKLNYTHPIGEKMKLETGYEGQMTFSDQDYLYYMTKSDGIKAVDSNSTTHFVYSQQIHAVYATFGATLAEGLTAQVGLRGEYSNVDGKDEYHAGSDVFKDYWQAYPTLHVSYQINKDQSVQLSYSRRVRRPHMHDLSPYMEVHQGQELSFGNPYLDPEFTNAFELSYNFGYKNLNVFTSAYFRQTNNMMTRYGYVWDSATCALYSYWEPYSSEYDGYWASTWQNLDKGLNYGLEFIVDYQIAKWWKVNLNLNLYENYIKGTELLDNKSTNAFQASGKLSSYMTLPKDWTLQLSGQYRAPFLDLQTEMDASYWVDLAVKKDVLNHRGTINLRVGDVFATGGFGHHTETEQLIRTAKNKRISPSITLGFSYKINNGLKLKPQQMEDSSSDSSSDE